MTSCKQVEGFDAFVRLCINMSVKHKYIKHDSWNWGGSENQQICMTSFMDPDGPLPGVAPDDFFLVGDVEVLFLSSFFLGVGDPAGWGRVHLGCHLGMVSSSGWSM